MPKGSLKLCYAPPSIPKFVLEYFRSHPFYWLWVTKAGPNAGKSFHVPHIPTHCARTAHRAVRWTVDLFHSFKAHLSSASLDSQGCVPTPLLQIYHNNILLHFRCQLASTSGSPSQPPLQPPGGLPPSSAAAATKTLAAPPLVPGPSYPPPSPCSSLEIACLQVEITQLTAQVANLTLKLASLSLPLSPPPPTLLA